VSRAPVADQEVHVLKTIFVGLCALVLVAQAAAAAKGERPATAPQVAKNSTIEQNVQELSLERKLALKIRAARRHASTIRFFKTHRWLVRSGARRAKALAALRRANRDFPKAKREVAYYRRLMRLREEQRRARRLAAAPPRVAICGVFGSYCRQALAVAACESRLSTRAQNGQYLGLFQMGSSERRLFGHGRTAYRQALAAHRYFVRSGRDWSPWSCGWAA
jgi:hypothetical protein